MGILKSFYEWLTYNPENIPVTKIIGPAILLLIIIMVVCFLAFSLITGKASFKACIASLLAAPYIMLTFFWNVCFMNEKTLVQMMPVYPLFVLFLTGVIRKHIKRKRECKEN